jgi:tRNA A-37 threonylcarbamoyl transferase component Bud32
MENESTQIDTYEIHNCCIIFENLVDYKIGFPVEQQQRLEFIKQLELTVEALHAAGVVHFDLYLSNIMHKIDSVSGKVKIKLIDFDASIFEWEKYF